MFEGNGDAHDMSRADYTGPKSWSVLGFTDLMLVGHSMTVAIALQPLVNDLSKRLRHAILYPGHKASIKFKLHTAVLHHESADVLCISVVLANWRISCELITVPIKTHGAGSVLDGQTYKPMTPDAWRLASGIHTST